MCQLAGLENYQPYATGSSGFIAGQGQVNAVPLGLSWRASMASVFQLAPGMRDLQVYLPEKASTRTALLSGQDNHEVHASGVEPANTRWALRNLLVCSAHRAQWHWQRITALLPIRCILAMELS